MKREDLLSKISDPSKVWDVVVIGGGATGLGVAVDAVTRGYSVALFEWEDFAKATTCRSTKMVHGGVRYLAQGDVSLVLVDSAMYSFPLSTLRYHRRNRRFRIHNPLLRPRPHQQVPLRQTPALYSHVC